MEKINEDLKDKFNNLLSIKNTLQNDLLTLQSLLDQEKSTNNNIIERLNEIEGESLKSLKKKKNLFIIFIFKKDKREAALIEISKLKERDGVHLSENTQLKATLNQLEKVFFIKIIFYA